MRHTIITSSDDDLVSGLLGRWSQVPAEVPRNREKLPLSTPENDSNLTRNWDFWEKMWHLSHPRTAILLYELADPQGSRSKGRIAVSEWGKSHIFSKMSQFLVKFDSFLGIESGNFPSRKSPQHICGFLKKNRKSEKFERIFPKKKSHFRPQKTSRIQREFGFFFKKCGTFLIRRRQFSCRNDYLGD